MKRTQSILILVVTFPIWILPFLVWCTVTVGVLSFVTVWNSILWSRENLQGIPTKPYSELVERIWRGRN